MNLRKNAPVFVVGSPRSGTTLFYHLLLSSGDFALYRAEARILDMLVPHFGDLGRRKNREALLAAWLPSEFFRRSQLDAEKFHAQARDSFADGVQLLRLFMEAICAAQGVRRWAECTPMNVLFIPEIKRKIPDALFVHVIRDGRDVALSYAKQGWMRPLHWDRSRNELICGLYWKWLVERGQQAAASLATDYMEVRFEELNANPKDVLRRVGEFIEHDLDYERISRSGVGSVSEPNTSFRGELKKGAFQPVARWKSRFPARQLAAFENILGPFLTHLGYSLSTLEKDRAALDLHSAWCAKFYPYLFSAKHWLKMRTPFGRLTDISLLSDFHAFDQERLVPAEQENSAASGTSA